MIGFAAFVESNSGHTVIGESMRKQHDVIFPLFFWLSLTIGALACWYYIRQRPAIPNADAIADENAVDASAHQTLNSPPAATGSPQPLVAQPLVTVIPQTPLSPEAAVIAAIHAVAEQDKDFYGRQPLPPLGPENPNGSKTVEDIRDVEDEANRYRPA